MNQVTISEFKKLKAAEVTALAPVEILSDGTVIGTFRTPTDKQVANVTITVPQSEYQDTGETQCPNCKFKYQLPKKDNKPAYFSIQHP